LRRLGYRFRLVFNFLDEDLKKVIKLVTPMIIGLSAGRVNLLISTLLASFLLEGAISYLNYSYRLMHFPMGVFAVALGTVALPRVSELVSQKNTRALTDTFHEAMGLNLFVLVPSAVFLAMLGHEIVQLIYQWGAFSSTDAENTHLALLHYSYGLVGFATVRVIVPFYYAYDDSRFPMKISILTVVVNILLYYPMIKMLNFAGLAAATSIAGLLNCVLLVYFLPRKGITISFNRLGLTLFRIVIAAFLAGYISRMIPIPFNESSELITRLIGLLVPAFSAVVIYLLFCFILRVKELNRVFRGLFRVNK